MPKWIVCLFMTFCAASGFSQMQEKSLDDTLRDLKGKIVIFQQPYKENQLKFDRQGTLIGKSEIGQIQYFGALKLDKYKWNKNLIELTGGRMLLSFPPGERQLNTFDSYERVKLTFDSSPELWTTEDFLRVLLKVFRPKEALDSFQTFYWKQLANDEKELNKARDAGEPIAMLGGNRPVYLVKEGLIVPPKVIYNPDPIYSDRSRNNREQGTVIMSVVISDAGIPEIVEVTKPLNLGLTESAVQAVRQWRFKPATRNGKPVIIRINIEVNFNLY